MRRKGSSPGDLGDREIRRWTLRWGRQRNECWDIRGRERGCDKGPYRCSASPGDVRAGEVNALRLGQIWRHMACAIQPVLRVQLRSNIGTARRTLYSKHSQNSLFYLLPLNWIRNKRNKNQQFTNWEIFNKLLLISI